jgi:hypothetical protein
VYTFFGVHGFSFSFIDIPRLNDTLVQLLFNSCWDGNALAGV